MLAAGNHTLDFKKLPSVNAFAHSTRPCLPRPTVGVVQSTVMTDFKDIGNKSALN